MPHHTPTQTDTSIALHQLVEVSTRILPSHAQSAVSTPLDPRDGTTEMVVVGLDADTLSVNTPGFALDEAVTISRDALAGPVQLVTPKTDRRGRPVWGY